MAESEETAIFSRVENERASAEEMDEKRHENIGYEYLCRLEEAKVWIEACIKEELPPTTELEENLRNGVYLAKLANFFLSKVSTSKKLNKNIYDVTQTRFKDRGLHFRHTDNINFWITAMEHIGMPTGILPETTDVYDRKNMPRVIYCLHGLSMFLHNLGVASKIQDLSGKVNFTADEISAVSQELKKYGIQMPAFETIGGIITTKVPVDEAALHAAIIAINETVDKMSLEELLTALKNPTADVGDIDCNAIEGYQRALLSAKSAKCEIRIHRPHLPDVVHDAYDELLTQKEIEDCVHSVNREVALDNVKVAVDSKDTSKLLKALQSPCLNFENVDSDNVASYVDRFEQVILFKQNNVTGEPLFEISELQDEINLANEDARQLAEREKAVMLINVALQSGTPEDTLFALQLKEAQLPSVSNFAAPLYHEEFSYIQNENEGCLSYEELNGGVIVLNAVANVNVCVEAGNDDETYSALNDENVHISGLDVDCKRRYQSALFDAKAKKVGNCCLLTHLEVQECIDSVNLKAQEENDRIVAIQAVNDALKLGDSSQAFHALLNPILELSNVDVEQKVLYHRMLDNERLRKCESFGDDSLDEEADLWIDEIREVVNRANILSSTAYRSCVAIAIINLAIERDDTESFELAIQNPEAQLVSIVPSCFDVYREKMMNLKRHKLQLGDGQHWVEFKTREAISLFLDVETMEPVWKASDSENLLSSCLSRDEIQGVISATTSEYDRHVLYEMMQPQIIKLQAFSRGFLVRRRFNQRLRFLHSQLKAITKIQGFWRGYHQRQVYKQRLEYLKGCVESIIKIQAVVRMFLARKRYLQRLSFLKNQVDAVTKIQTFWRGNKTRKAFQELTSAQMPSFVVVQQFVHLLSLSNLDFAEELELHRLRGEVVKAIRHNQQLDKDLTTMDIKIGLLVKNRITLQDVVAHGTKMENKSKESEDSSEQHAATVGLHHGLKALSKESRSKVEAYQHLFYALQTDSRYLSRLIFFPLPGKANKFVETFIVTLFNYGSNQREEFLLLKLFQITLQEEIKNRVDQPSDIAAGNSLIIKMIVGFYRNRRGQGALREILGPLVKQVLDDNSLQINTNPVDVYKWYINQLESDSGQPSGLPYNVSQDEALRHEAVRVQIQESVSSLKENTLLFFQAILSSLDKIPYGILYMAKVLKECLEEKFPDIPQKEILKVVGNLLYYRYINSAIVAPDAFDIVDVAASQSFTAVQRTNLGSIAKILQFATSKTGFGDESPHLVCLNPFIIECHEKFKEFFMAACNVGELKEHFKVDEYTEATMLTKPVIYISLQEICDLHMLLLEHQNTLAPDSNDPLHELLEDLGDRPSVEALVGENYENLSPVQMSTIEICLTLTNKFEVPQNTKDDLNQLFVRTKQMVVDIMHCIESSDIIGMINTIPSEPQKNKYLLLLEEKNKQIRKAESENKQKILRRTPSDSDSINLEDALSKVSHNLNVLELEGYVSSKNNYLEMVKSIALEIRNRRRYRIRRRQDLVHLRTTITNLHTKTVFYEEQVDYYNQYLKQCLNNMATGSKKMRRSGKDVEKKVKSKMTRKYTAAKLNEKGVIVSMEGLAKNQFKNILFEISPSDMAGVFGVKVKYMGTSLSDVELDIQDLLELQFEGVSVTRLFDRAEINVNLLLFLLNKEFYTKTK